jgi:hypothetical protein
MSTEGQVSDCSSAPSTVEAHISQVITCKAAVAWEAGEFVLRHKARPDLADTISQASRH